MARQRKTTAPKKATAAKKATSAKKTTGGGRGKKKTSAS